MLASKMRARNPVLRKMQQILSRNPGMRVGELIQQSHSAHYDKSDGQMWHEPDDIFLKRLQDFEKKGRKGVTS